MRNCIQCYEIVIRDDGTAESVPIDLRPPLAERHGGYRTNVRPAPRLPVAPRKTPWWRLAWWVVKLGPLRAWWRSRYEWVIPSACNSLWAPKRMRKGKPRPGAAFVTRPSAS